jgi:hypothetical protein
MYALWRMQATAAAEDLYARQSRHSQFATAAERDASLRTQIKSITAAAKTKSKGVATVEVCHQPRFVLYQECSCTGSLGMQSPRYSS